MKERKGDRQKLKMLYLAKIFSEETDELHGLTVQEIIQKLSGYGVNADRRTLYMDFEELRSFGMDILSVYEGRRCFYYLVSRTFELPELKLLVDAVQAAKFITDKKSQDLIKKLESLVSRHDARSLHRQVVISGRNKAMNEGIYYNVDKLQEAINGDCRVRFKYFQWNLKKEMVFRRGGAFYNASPWALMWEDENYYLVAFDAEDKKIKHFRVDKMKEISVEACIREGRDYFEQFNMPQYSKSLFGMYGGEEIEITLEADNDLAGVLIDRFGKGILIIPSGEGRFKTYVKVAFSNQFLGWIMALGDKIKITGPPTAVERMRTELEKTAAQYR